MSSQAATSQEGMKFVDARTASKLVNYSPDYITRLAREGKIEAVQAGRQWLVDAESLKLFTLEVQAEKRRRADKIREERRAELVAHTIAPNVSLETSVADTSLKQIAFAKTVALSACAFLCAHLFWFSLENNIDLQFVSGGLNEIQDTFMDSTFAVVTGALQAASLTLAGAGQAGESSASFEKKPTVSDKLNSDSDQFQGIVIMPESDRSAESVQKIRESFSDDVRVEFDGVDTGVVTPVFEDRSGDTYRFLLAPVSTTE